MTILCKCKCGIYDIQCDNSTEYFTLGGILNLKIQKLLKKHITYSLQDSPIINNKNLINLITAPSAKKTYEGYASDVLLQNDLIFDIFNNRIVNKKSLQNNNISSNNRMIGFAACNSYFKSIYFKFDDGLSEIIDYETF